MCQKIFRGVLYIYLLFTSLLICHNLGANATSLVARQPVSNSSKAGLAWPNGNDVDIIQYLSSGKLSWYYTWSVWPAGSRRNTLEFVPMLWGPSTVNDFVADVNDIIRRSNTHVTALLGMNEPEQQGQANLTAAEGVELWRQYMEPLRSSSLRLGSPAMSSAPSGKTWLQDFFRECNGSCNADFVALRTDGNAFIAHLWDYWYTFNRTIWVTEWACHNFVNQEHQCSPGDVVGFMNKTQSFMDSATFVERYAWFGAMKDLQGVNPANALMDDDGRISDLGRQYIDWETAPPAVSSGVSETIPVRTQLLVVIRLITAASWMLGF